MITLSIWGLLSLPPHNPSRPDLCRISSQPILIGMEHSAHLQHGLSVRLIAGLAQPLGDSQQFHR